jgi:DNA-binding LacI/PurR family transcriptional regulator
MVTMKDIGTEAGVSQATVSYVLNNRRGGLKIKEETRARINSIAAKLNYSRNATAAMMKTGRSNLIIYVDNIMGKAEYSAVIVSALMEYCAERQYNVKVFSCATKNCVPRVFEERPAGIITRSIPPEIFGLLKKYVDTHKTPLISLSRQEEYPDINSIVADEEGGGEKALRHLAWFGHTNFAIIAPLTEQSRERGFRLAAYKAGLSVKPENILRLKNHSVECLGKIEKFLKRKELPTAFYCVTDYHAMRLMQVAYNMNMKVPEDFSVIGVAGLTAGEYCSPPLTSLALEKNMGTVAAEKIFKMINSKNFATEKLIVEKIPMKLITRSSTGQVKKEVAND